MPIEPTNYYAYTFYLRMPNSNGLVATWNPNGAVSAAPIQSGARARQLFRFQKSPFQFADPHQVLIATVEPTPRLLEPGDPVHLTSQNPPSSAVSWTRTQDRKFYWGGVSRGLLARKPDSFLATMNHMHPDPAWVPQQFEFVCATDFGFIRNSVSGRVLTADAAGAVTWAVLKPTDNDSQQWGIYPNGYLVNLATGQVLQLAEPKPRQGLALRTGNQIVSPVADYQRFDTHQQDGTFLCLAAGADGHYYAISANTSDPEGPAIVHRHAPPFVNNSVECVSPLQFFLMLNGDAPWLLGRAGEEARLTDARADDDPRQLFTLLRHGELLNPVDGRILQSAGDGPPPRFVDPPSVPQEAEFEYGRVSQAFADFGGLVTIGSGSSHIGLYNRRVPATHPAVSFRSLRLPVKGPETWKLVGRAQSLIEANYPTSREFFTREPAFPPFAAGENAAGSDNAASSGRQASLAPSKQQQVAFAIVNRLLTIVCGVLPRTPFDSLVGEIGDIVLADAQARQGINAMVASHSAGADTIMAVAQQMTTVNLWSPTLAKLLPRSYYGHVLLVLRLQLMLAPSSYADVGYSLYGHRVDSELVPEVQNIVR